MDLRPSFPAPLEPAMSMRRSAVRWRVRRSFAALTMVEVHSLSTRLATPGSAWRARPVSSETMAR